MAKQLIVSITDQQESALTQYLGLPKFNPWAFSESSGQNEPVPMYTTIEALLDAELSRIVNEAVAQFPPTTIQTKQEQIRQLQAEISLESIPTPIVTTEG